MEGRGEVRKGWRGRSAERCRVLFSIKQNIIYAPRVWLAVLAWLSGVSDNVIMISGSWC